MKLLHKHALLYLLVLSLWDPLGLSLSLSLFFGGGRKGGEGVGIAISCRKNPCKSIDMCEMETILSVKTSQIKETETPLLERDTSAS